VGKTATLTVDVSDQPAPAWGAATGDRPPSFSK
jgi:hypothetical protein